MSEPLNNYIIKALKYLALLKSWFVKIFNKFFFSKKSTFNATIANFHDATSEFNAIKLGFNDKTTTTKSYIDNNIFQSITLHTNIVCLKNFNLVKAIIILSFKGGLPFLAKLFKENNNLLHLLEWLDVNNYIQNIQNGTYTSKELIKKIKATATSWHFKLNKLFKAAQILDLLDNTNLLANTYKLESSINAYTQIMTDIQNQYCLTADQLKAEVLYELITQNTYDPEVIQLRNFIMEYTHRAKTKQKK